MKYYIYTDGSARGNPGPGGWGALIMDGEDRITFIASDQEEYTTNNRMELKAMICALSYAMDHPTDEFIIYCDSAYVVNSVNTWIYSWVKNGWRNSKKQEVENIDLMKQLWAFISRGLFNVEVRKCDGHSGIMGNELADLLATNKKEKFNELIEFWELEYINPDF